MTYDELKTILERIEARDGTLDDGEIHAMAQHVEMWVAEAIAARQRAEMWAAEAAEWAAKAAKAAVTVMWVELPWAASVAYWNQINPCALLRTMIEMTGNPSNNERTK